MGTTTIISPSKTKVLLRSLLISYIISGLLILALSLALYKLKLNEGQINISVFLIYILSCFIGGFVAGKSLKQRRFLWGMLSGILYFAVLLAASYFVKSGNSPALAPAAMVMGSCILGGALGGMLS